MGCGASTDSGQSTTAVAVPSEQSESAHAEVIVPAGVIPSAILSICPPCCGTESVCSRAAEDVGITCLDIDHLPTRSTSGEHRVKAIRKKMAALLLTGNELFLMRGFPLDDHDMRAWFQNMSEFCYVSAVLHFEADREKLEAKAGDDPSAKKQLADYYGSVSVLNSFDQSVVHRIQVTSPEVMIGEVRRICVLAKDHGTVQNSPRDRGGEKSTDSHMTRDQEFAIRNLMSGAGIGHSLGDFNNGDRGKAAAPVRTRANTLASDFGGESSTSKPIAGNVIDTSALPQSEQQGPDDLATVEEVRV